VILLEISRHTMNILRLSLRPDHSNPTATSSSKDFNIVYLSCIRSLAELISKFLPSRLPGQLLDSVRAFLYVMFYDFEVLWKGDILRH
jgi:hypothetical protein